MHDWTLKSIRFDWAAAQVIIELEDMTLAARSLVAEGVQELHVPRANEWGPSVSINEVSEIEALSSGLKRLRIEMQSGDRIEVVARHFSPPAS